MSKEYCIVHHDDKTSLLPYCGYQTIQIGDLRELLQKMAAFCSKYQNTDILYTLLSIDLVVKLLSTIDNSLKLCRGQFIPKTETKEWADCRALPKKALVERMQKTFVELLPKDYIDAN